MEWDGTFQFEAESITSLSRYIDVVTKARSGWPHWHPWFRGLKKASHKLDPTAYRRTEFDEDAAFNSFWARGRGLAGLRDLPVNHYWDWYFAARHHGLPTRLLDWSHNALVALFFATEPYDQAGSTEDARVWLLDPTWMNEVFFGYPDTIIPSGEGDDFAKHWLPENVVRGKPREFEEGGKKYANRHPVAIYPTHTNHRLVAQQGMFTVHGADTRPLDAQLKDYSPREVRMGFVNIDKTCISTIHQQLSVLGLHRFALMVDADSLADYVSR